MIIYFLSFFWFFRTTKRLLFWLYLWQLKEYHLKRFLAHFDTAKGKSLFLNKIFALKLFLFIGFVLVKEYQPILLLILTFIYFLEFFKAGSSFLKKKLKKPVLTKKTIPLIITALGIEVLLLLVLFLKIEMNIDFYLLSFDILTPLIASLIVLGFEPIAILERRRIIRKAAKKRARFNDLLVIGITGSYGKTSTKEFLAKILSKKFKVLKTKKHINAEIGIAKTVLNSLKKEHQVFVVEIGAYEGGKIRRVCKMIKPKIGVLTGINEQHLATFGSLKNTIKAKYELIEALPEDGLAVFNGNNNYCVDLYQKTKKRKKICSSSSLPGINPDFSAKDIAAKKESLFFKAFSKEEMAVFELGLLGEQNVENILMAAAVAKELGVSLEEVAETCKELKPNTGAMKLIKNKINIIDSTYSANPNGVLSHLEYLKNWKGKKVIVMPCLIELGNAARKIHKEVGRKIGEVCNLAIITTKEYFKELREGAVEEGIPSSEVLFMEKSNEILKKIKDSCQKGDVVLLESRVPKEVIKSIKRLS